MTGYQYHPRRNLLERAHQLDTEAAGMPDRAARLLHAVAGHLREAAGIYETDPTLVDCPTGRERALGVIAELGRQIWPLVRHAATRPDDPRWPTALRWEEAEALTARLPEFLKRAHAVARPDHATEEGSRDISHQRLTAAHEEIAAAADHLRRAVANAAALPYPAPTVTELLNLANQIDTHADALEKEWHTRTP
ncbi:hypothetical protein ACFWYW_46830 [Nonomuraea sp. NPDC059023]|uniref:hypothetical protein n=1 Tax=unclassified Nonomuraea TaxID=2593643 RepID=UPI00369AE894